MAGTANTLLLLLGTSFVSSAIAASVPPLSYSDSEGKIVDAQTGKTVVDFVRPNKNNAVPKVVSDKDQQCMEVSVTPISKDQSVLHCFPLGEANWYGGPENIPQKWPLEKYTKLKHSMVTQETANRGITDPFWINSEGLSIFVKPGVPLFMSINYDQEGSLCLEAKLEAPYRPRDSNHLEYYVCKSENPKEAFKHALSAKFIKIPTGYPDERMIQHPIWSTWAKYKAEINEEIVRDFAKQIKDNGFENSQLEIDDNWETCYGSKIVDKSRFPNMKQLTDDLRNDGFRVTIWTHPFINLDCTETFNEAKSKGFLVPDLTGNTTTVWWNGKAGAGIVDFTKKEAQDWFAMRHRDTAEENGFDGYKFDAGETSWNPQLPDFYSVEKANDEQYPGFGTRKYVETCAEFGNITEIRAAYYTQELPVFVRMIDKDSRWGDNNGLKSLVTTLLQMNTVGYSLVLPDMVGGNEYEGEKTNKELFIRWLQANTFMPSIQFSLVPWDYDEETVKISKKFTKLHADNTDKIIAAMKRNVQDGTPVNPPIWWIDPTDKRALQEDTEFLLGDDILVAPILEDKARKRNVFLPKGKWKDGNSDTVWDGPITINDYKADLDVLPYFIKQGEPNSSSTHLAGVLSLISASVVLLLSKF